MSSPATRHPFTPFWATLAVIAVAYILFLVALLATTAAYSSPGQIAAAMRSAEIRHALQLSLATCTAAAILSLLLAVPIAYLLSRREFPGKALVEALLDIPIVLPPMVVGLCLLIFFQSPLGRAIETVVPFTYTVYGIVLAQTLIGTSLAVRSMRGTFEHLSARPEEVAMTLGCTRAQAVWRVTLPAARSGMFAAASLAWARSLGEFGPILVFAGATRMRTEVLPTTIWLELGVGNLAAAISVSLLLMALAVLVLVALRCAGERP